jgi:uncharacterized RDD family membrane protein YckC
MSYAGIVTRAVALVIDAALVNAIAVMAGAVTRLVASLFGGDVHLDLGGALAAGIGWFLWVGLYFTAFWALTGQTPGSRTLGIRVVSASGGSVGLVQAARRFGGLVLSALPAGLGFMPVLFDERRRGLHDRIGGTVVQWVGGEAAEAHRPLLTRGGPTSPGVPPPRGL